MNKLMCFLTGGHRYSDANVVSTYQEHSKTVLLKNRCVKCGAIITAEIDTDKILAEDMRLIRERRKYDR